MTIELLMLVLFCAACYAFARAISVPDRWPTFRTQHDRCLHPAWRVDRLLSPVGTTAITIRCFRCGVAARDRFDCKALSDGAISVVNRTRNVQKIVIAGELHEMMPPSQWSPYEDDEHESLYAVFLPPEDLRKA